NLVTGESYGVATNEPYENPENPLIDYLASHLSYGSANVNIRYQGRDEDQFRGPISMNVLPGPSIGYERVVKKPIFQDKYTGTGFTVIQYHTAREYPFDGYYKALGKPGILHGPNGRQTYDVDIRLFQ